MQKDERSNCSLCGRAGADQQIYLKVSSSEARGTRMITRTQTHSSVSCQPCFKALEDLEKREKIGVAIAFGPAGVATLMHFLHFMPSGNAEGVIWGAAALGILVGVVLASLAQKARVAMVRSTDTTPMEAMHTLWVGATGGKAGKTHVVPSTRKESGAFVA